MARFTVNMACDDDAPNPAPEIARVLRDIADKIERVGASGFYETIRDTNGNDIGRFALKNDDGSNWNGRNMTASDAVFIVEQIEEANENKQIEAWQFLIDTGIAWKLQGWFGRTAAGLIKAGICHRKGE